MAYGRFINDVDIREARKVCVIGKRVYESLFKPGEDPCGRYVQVDSVYYRIVGMCSSEGNVNIQGQASESVTLPYTTMKNVYNLGDKVQVVCFTMKPGYEVKDVQPEVERRVKEAHYIHPDDPQAVMLLNLEAMFSMMDNLMTGTRILAWLVGAGHALGRRHRGEQHHDGDREGTHRGDRHSAVPSGQGRATSLQQIMAEEHHADYRGGIGGHFVWRLCAQCAGNGSQSARASLRRITR